MSRSARRTAGLAAIALLVVACSATPARQSVGPADSPQPTAVAQSNSPAAAPATVAPTVPASFSDPDPALVGDYMADGATEAEAVFLTLTQTTTEQIGPLSYRIVHLFPTGNTADMTVTVTPDVIRDPDGEDAFSATYTDSADGLEFRIEYFLAYDDMPDHVEQEITGAPAASRDRLAIAGQALVPLAAEKSGALVIGEGLVKAFNSSQTSSFLKYLEGRLGTGAELNNLYKAIKQLLSVRDALAMQDEFSAIDEAINKLRKCAENPTNPITRNAYRDDPSYRQRILDQVEATRAEIKSNTAVMFLALANASFSSITQVKWLGFVIGPATAWSKNTLKELNSKLLDELKRSITKCEGYRIDKTVSATQLNVSVTIRYTGTKCGGPDGEWVIDSSGTLTGYGGTAEIGGPIIVELDPDTLTGTVDGTANFSATTTGQSQGRFTGTAAFVAAQPPRLELNVTGGSGNGYQFGFLDTGFVSPGTLTFPLETGDFCDD